MPKVSVTLTDKSIKNALRAFKQSTSRKKRLCDGGCKGLNLILLKTNSGTSVRWEVRGLGVERSLYGLTYPDCGINEARNKAREYFASLRSGIDPLIEKERIKQEQAEQTQEAIKQAYTFGKASHDWFEMVRKADKWINDAGGEKKAEINLRCHIIPVVGDVPINEFTWRHVYDVMMHNDLYRRKSEQAKKCRAIINQVCLYAHTHGYRDAEEEPARLIGALKAKLDLVVPVKKEKGHEPRVEPDDIPEFFAQIDEFEGVGAKMLKFCILTASRPGMVQKAKHTNPITKTSFVTAVRWEDIDLDAGTWTVSPIVMKMKGREEFVVHLSSYAIAFLRSIPRFEGCPWVFTRDGRNPIGAGAMARVIDSMNAKRRARGLREWIDEKESKRLGRPINASPHGTARSSFRTWLTTDKHKNYQRFNLEAIELCLAHFVGDEYGGGYNRPDLSDSRRECMEAWGRYCTTGLYPDE